MRTIINFSFSRSNLSNFKNVCEATIKNVFNGTKKATEQACKEIYDESLAQVPKDTFTLAASAYYEVRRRPDIKSYRYEGIIGYGGNGDPINPKRHVHASTYMLPVHEDLTAEHPVGKAKFLEDPVRAYGETHFKRVVTKYIREELEG
jgi:hypothetical protein